MCSDTQTHTHKLLDRVSFRHELFRTLTGHCKSWQVINKTQSVLVRCWCCHKSFIAHLPLDSNGEMAQHKIHKALPHLLIVGPASIQLVRQLWSGDCGCYPVTTHAQWMGASSSCFSSKIFPLLCHPSIPLICLGAATEKMLKHHVRRFSFH